MNNNHKTTKNHDAIQIIRGFIPTKYSQRQQQYKQLRPQTNETNIISNDKNDKWTPKLILFLWRESQALWTIRNQETHHHLKTTSILQEKITTMYNEQHNIHATARNIIFHETLHSVITKSNQYMQQWIEQFQPLFIKSRQSSREATTNIQSKITAFFRPNQS
jgi:hypothetical protein